MIIYYYYRPSTNEYVAYCGVCKTTLAAPKAELVAAMDYKPLFAMYHICPQQTRRLTPAERRAAVLRDGGLAC